MFKWLLSNDNVKDFWNAITRNKNALSKKEQDDFDCAMFCSHALFALIGAIIAGVNTFLGCYVLIFLVAALIIGVIWASFDIHGKLAAGYFFAMSAFSFAWVVYLPILLVLLIFSSPIIITSYLEYKDNESFR
jgi:hypothetical protein